MLPTLGANHCYGQLAQATWFVRGGDCGVAKQCKTWVPVRAEGACRGAACEYSHVVHTGGNRGGD
jgi:hypothetical protein